MWCIPDSLNQEYIERMEDVLNLYEKPYNSSEPVVCLDEKPATLREDLREPSRAKPGSSFHRDSEYIRRGTANVFCAVEPKTGKYFASVTANRKGKEYAKFLFRLSKKFPRAKTIHLVQDNLNIHKIKSLINFYGRKKAKKIWKRFTIHYTPKHGSWLNQAEIAISIYSRQCLGKRRIPNLELLRNETNAWLTRINREKRIINWQFSTKENRKKFQYRKSKKSVIFRR